MQDMKLAVIVSMREMTELRSALNTIQTASNYYRAIIKARTTRRHRILCGASDQRGEYKPRTSLTYMYVVTLGSLLWLLNTTSNLMTLFILVWHVLGLRAAFGFIFLN